MCRQYSRRTRLWGAWVCPNGTKGVASMTPVAAAVHWLLKVEHDDPSKRSDEDLRVWASLAAEPTI